LSLSSSQPSSLARSDSTDDTFILEDTLYMFTSKHCTCGYSKVFCSAEAKAKHEKNRTCIKTAKREAQLKAVSKTKRIYRLYHEEFDSRNALFRHLAGGYIGTGTETASESEAIEAVYLI
jgi:hypothetical protein